MAKSGNYRAVAFASLSILIGLTIPVLLLEAVLRFLPVYGGLYGVSVNASQPVLRFDPNREFTYSRGWNLRGVNTGHVNNYGFINDQDYDPATKSPLIAVIGDSYVEALMTPYAETLYGLLAVSAQGRGRVYSFGTSGAPLSQYLAWASWVEETFQPAALVITVVGNDFDESLLRYKNAPGFYYFDDAREDWPLVRVDLVAGVFRGKLKLAKHSALYRYLRFNLKFVDTLKQLVASPNTMQYIGNVPAQVESERIKRSKRAVDTFLGRLPSASGVAARLTVLVVDGMRPSLYEPEDMAKAEKSYFGEMRNYFMERAVAHGYTIVDMQPRFIEHHKATAERFEFPDDGHWNTLGHAMAADAVKSTRAFQEVLGL